MQIKAIVPEVVRFLFIVLFLYTAFTKLADYERFVVQLGQSPLLAPYANGLAWLVPAVEIGVSILLITARYQLLGLFASFGLMVLFTAYIIAILNFSESIPCSCGGVLGTLGWKEHLVFNVGFVGLGVLGILFKTEGLMRKH